MRVRFTRREFLGAGATSAVISCSAGARKAVVLTFDDAVKSHRTFVAPLLKDLGLRATFFVTHRWMDDATNFMTWDDIAEIHRMGFEIGNHSWTHASFSVPKNAARLAGELALVENALAKVEVPRPVSFAWCGNNFGPEALKVLRDVGCRFARRGKEPEGQRRTLQVGVPYEPEKHDPLLIPSTGIAIPDWTLQHFRSVLALCGPGKIVVLQFHGVPDVAHSWVHTPPEVFRQCMEHLKNEGYSTLAVRDLEQLVPAQHPEDPVASIRVPELQPGEPLVLPKQTQATQADLGFWMENMLGHHNYTVHEAAEVSGLAEDRLQTYVRQFAASGREPSEHPKVLPYPGGRHPRIGFLEGAIDPLRGTKASVFLPWNPEQYVVVDLPEAVFSNLGLLFLAHTDVPTIWNEQNVVIENVDWRRETNGGSRHEWTLPNQVSFGASMRPRSGRVDMELWLRNGTDALLSKLRTQICVMLKGAPDFNEQTLDNKIFQEPVAAVRSSDGKRWILTAWQQTGRSWGSPRCPCFHADPVLPDCRPGDTVRVKGRLWFYEGEDADSEIARGAAAIAAA